MKCRFCNIDLNHIFVSLGNSPLSNAYLTAEQLNEMEPFFPLDVYVCENCFLVQLGEYESPETIFSDYGYFSSYAKSWLVHCQKYVDTICKTYPFSNQSLVVEIASNDGYLLQYFAKKNIPVLGVEPAKNVAQAAIEKGIPTDTVFFSAQTAEQMVHDGKAADLIIGNNVLAHVPNLNDFVQGLKILLKKTGFITMEFPHLKELMDHSQFDTIYHEHFSYFSFTTVTKIFAQHGLKVFDVERLPTHGGSLRIHAAHEENNVYADTDRKRSLLALEGQEGFSVLTSYLSFSAKVTSLKRQILRFLINAKENGKTIAGYGAPAKGNTLLNFCGIRTDFIDYTVDRSSYKQGRYLPGSHIPVFSPERIFQTKPDYLIIMPWNLKDEIVEQMSGIREWNGKFVVFVPEVEVF